MSPKFKITSRDLNFYYGDFQALHQVNLDFQECQVTALIGLPDAGKARFYVASTG